MLHCVVSCSCPLTQHRVCLSTVCCDKRSGCCCQPGKIDPRSVFSFFCPGSLLCQGACACCCVLPWPACLLAGAWCFLVWGGGRCRHVSCLSCRECGMVSLWRRGCLSASAARFTLCRHVIPTAAPGRPPATPERGGAVLFLAPRMLAVFSSAAVVRPLALYCVGQPLGPLLLPSSDRYQWSLCCASVASFGVYTRLEVLCMWGGSTVGCLRRHVPAGRHPSVSSFPTAQLSGLCRHWLALVSLPV
jgi:hypothetical protein